MTTVMEKMAMTKMAMTKMAMTKMDMTKMYTMKMNMTKMDMTKMDTMTEIPMTASVYQIARVVPVGMMAAVEPVAPAVVMKSARKEIA